MSKPPHNKICLSGDDWKKINAACSIQCTGEEIARIMGFSYDTLERKIKQEHKMSAADYIKMHAQEGKATLRRLQWKAAQAGNTAILIWLGKQYLGQSDKIEENQTQTIKRVNYRRISANAANQV